MTQSIKDFVPIALVLALSFLSPSAQAGTIARGQLQMVAPGHPTRGSLSVVQTGSERFLVIGEDFATVAGPDLRVALYANTSMRSPQIRYLELGLLREYAGQQVYRIPPDLRLDIFPNVAIWCRKFDVLFGAGALGLPNSPPMVTRGGENF